ncbi:MAG: cytochrome c oxidase subunit 3 [Ignavibacteria bacterium]|nr:cytochrome c oxidase subunit 3 [Ignavibacteria bacterium]
MSVIHRDDVGSKMGMWLFLFTELLLFGGMFLLYAAYRFAHPDAFKVASLKLDTALGMVNTIILLTSSLTVVLGIVALQRNSKKLSIFYLGITLLLGFGFLVNKYFEWGAKISKGIYPKGPEMANFSDGEVLYFGLYYAMTGLHGLHVLVGMMFLGIILLLIVKEKITADNFQKFENAGLYWHLVDIIWIFLFPLFYLIH